jgi:cell division initiation protein
VALSPEDIVNHEFRQALRGYAIPEVDDLLDRVADQLERAQADIDDLRLRLQQAEARLGAALETEATLKRTFVTAQQAAEQALDGAREQAEELRRVAEREVLEQLRRAQAEAERLVTEARSSAEEELRQAREQRAAMVAEVAALAELERRQRATLRQQLQGYLAALDGSGTASPTASEQPT